MSNLVEAAGGEALPCVVDVRSEDAVQNSIESAVKQFGGVDIVVNNASAISLTDTESTSMKKYDLMNSINGRGTYLVSKCALPYLKVSKKNPHILNISPPLNMNPRWFKGHVAYTMAKYGMSMCVLGMAEEFREHRIAVNALWPRTAIITAAMEMIGGGKGIAERCRTVDIMADAAYVMLTRDAGNYTGNFAIDEDVLKEEGVKDFAQYAVNPKAGLMPDFFLDCDEDFKDSLDEAKQEIGGNGNIDDIFAKIEKNLNEEIVQKTKAVFGFTVKGT